MRSDISAALSAHFANPTTQVGYLMTVNASITYHWSNIGTVNYRLPGQAVTTQFTDAPFTISGLSFSPDTDPACTVAFDNHDNTIGALFQNEFISDVIVDIYQFGRNCLYYGDAPYLAQMAVDGFQCSWDSVQFSLVSFATSFAMSPRRRIDASNGFANALPPNVQIPWENEIMILTPDPNMN